MHLKIRWWQKTSGRQLIMYAMLLLAEGLGVKFAFPSQSLYIESMPPESGAKMVAGDDQLSSSLHKIDSYFQGKHKPG